MQKDQKGSMITDTFTINARPRGCVHVFDFCHDWTNIFNDGDKGVQICISPTFIEPSVYQAMHQCYQGMHQCCMHVRDTDGRTDRRNTPVPLICLLTGVLVGRKTKLKPKDRHTD